MNNNWIPLTKLPEDCEVVFSLLPEPCSTKKDKGKRNILDNSKTNQKEL